MEIGVSFVVGDSTIDIPFSALLLSVREQIAKATAVTTNGFADSWGEPGIAVIGDSERKGDEWNDAVFHFDHHVTPYAEDDAGLVLTALNEGFEAERESQLRNAEAAWFGSGDTTGFTCEVPYGRGPFPLGVIGGGLAPHLQSDSTKTGLIQAWPMKNPHVGNGVLLIMRLPERPQEEELWWTAALLNAQNRLNGGGVSPGAAHGIGAWLEHDGEVKFALFVPASWARTLGHDELVQLARQLLANCARLSWSSRTVLEPYCDSTPMELVQSAESPPRGLAAGWNARGLEFGEPGVGTDPGAVKYRV